MHTNSLTRAGRGLLGLMLWTAACSDDEGARADGSDPVTGQEAPPPAVDSLLDASAGPSDAGLADASQLTDSGLPAPDASVEPEACQPRLPPACPSPPTRYVDIEPIFTQRCVAPCHSPRWTGPWPLDSYEHVADWQDTIRIEMLNCTMPPPDAGIPMTLEERNRILSWIRCGIPR